MSRKLMLLGCSTVLALFSVASVPAAERFTFKKTNDPRPDILPRPFYDAHVEYRRAYNRPRYVLGWLATKVAPTSQEAMSWHDNKRMGRYEKHNMPPLYKQYFYPKPWEVLTTGARPNTQISGDTRRLSSETDTTIEPSRIESPSVPEPIPSK